MGSARHVQAALHECLELSGSWIALAVAMLLWLRVEREEWSPRLMCVASMLVGTALVSAAHGVAPSNSARFAWLHDAAALYGGLLAALVWLPIPFGSVRRRRFFVATVMALAVAMSAAIWRYGSWLPAPLVHGDFSLASRTANILGGLGFLSAAVFFIRRYQQQPAAEDLIFTSYTLLFSASSLYFDFTHVWDAEWWVWHGFRLLAYGIVLLAAFRMVLNLHKRIARHALELELRVEARTAELRRWEAIVESSEEAIMSKSLDGVITTWNEGAVRLYGYTVEEAAGQNVALIVPPERQEEVQGLLQRIPARGTRPAVFHRAGAPGWAPYRRFPHRFRSKRSDWSHHRGVRNFARYHGTKARRAGAGAVFHAVSRSAVLRWLRRLFQASECSLCDHSRMVAGAVDRDAFREFSAPRRRRKDPGSAAFAQGREHRFFF